MGIIMKLCLRTEQDTRSPAEPSSTVIMTTEHDVVKSMRAQTRLYDEGVQAAGKGHTLRAGGSGRGGHCSDSDEHGHEVRPRQVLQGRSDVPIRTSSHHSVGRQVRRSRPSRGCAATVGSSTQVRKSTTDPTVSRTPTVAGRSTRQVGSDEAMLKAGSAWLGEVGISPRSPRWLSLARSEAVQRLSLPSLPVSPAFSVRQCSSDAMTRGLQPVVPSRISSISLTSRGVLPPSSLLEDSGEQTRTSTLRASSGGTRMLTKLGVPPPSCLLHRRVKVTVDHLQSQLELWRVWRRLSRLQ